MSSINPFGEVPATETVAGIVELATQAEVDAGVDTVHVITPATLAAAPGGDALPIVDTTAVVKGSADATKLVRIEADGLTTATTRVIIMADQDIDLTPTTGDFADSAHEANTANPHATGIDDVTPTTTKGDVIVEDGTNALRLGVGANDQVLTADSAQALGVKWADPGGGGAGLVFLSSVTASASATVDIETTFDSTFDSYLITIADLKVANDATNFLCRLKLGGTYLTTLYKFHSHRMNSNAGTYSSAISNSGSSMTVGMSLGSTAGEGGQFSMILSGVSGTALTKKIQWHGAFSASNTTSEASVGGGLHTSTSALTGVRFLMSTGNITSGIFRLYGITNS